MAARTPNGPETYGFLRLKQWTRFVLVSPTWQFQPGLQFPVMVAAGTRVKGETVATALVPTAVAIDLGDVPTTMQRIEMVEAWRARPSRP